MTADEKLFASILLVYGPPPCDPLALASVYSSTPEMHAALSAEKQYWDQATALYVNGYPSRRQAVPNFIWGRALARMHLVDSMRFYFEQWMRTEKLLTKYFG